MLNFEGSLQLLKIGLYTQGQDRWKLHAKTIHSLMGKSGSYKAAAKSGTSGPKICIQYFRKWFPKSVETIQGLKVFVEIRYVCIYKFQF